jgi:hypothetical protein
VLGWDHDLDLSAKRTQSKRVVYVSGVIVKWSSLVCKRIAWWILTKKRQSQTQWTGRWACHTTNCSVPAVSFDSVRWTLSWQLHTTSDIGWQYLYQSWSAFWHQRHIVWSEIKHAKMQVERFTLGTMSIFNPNFMTRVINFSLKNWLDPNLPKCPDTEVWKLCKISCMKSICIGYGVLG